VAVLELRQHLDREVDDAVAVEATLPDEVGVLAGSSSRVGRGLVCRKKVAVPVPVANRSAGVTLVTDPLQRLVTVTVMVPRPA
jgi:hypothetical protein